MLIGFGVLLSFSLTSENGPQLLETRFGSFGSALFDTTSLGTKYWCSKFWIIWNVFRICYCLFPSNVCSSNSWCSRNWNDDYDRVCTVDTIYCWFNSKKTPEFMSMKISPKDIKLANIIFLLHPAIILIPTVIAFTTGNAQQMVGEQVTSMGFTQTLYEYTSSAANNGSDYFGTSADTPFWNWSTAIVMFLGSCVPLGLLLTLAGSFTVKERKRSGRTYKNTGTFIYLCISCNDIFISGTIVFSISGDGTNFYIRKLIKI